MKKISLMETKIFPTYVKKGFSSNDDNEVSLSKKYQKIWNYCHYTEKFRRTAHDICNLRYKTPK